MMADKKKNDKLKKSKIISGEKLDDGWEIANGE
jgi:hypothetical protein